MPYFIRKLENMLQNLSSAAVMIGALKVNWIIRSILVIKLSGLLKGSFSFFVFSGFIFERQTHFAVSS